MTTPRLHRTGRLPAARRLLASALCAGAALTAFNDASAQTNTPRMPNKYDIVDQNMPVGTAAKWISQRDPGGMPYLQPVRVDLPSEGKVSFFGPRSMTPAQAAPAQAALMVGHTYRLKISDMPEFPGAELYPSVEVLDRLHPPRGKEHDFPVFMELTREDIELALNGGLVSKVIYLEQPSVAKPIQQDRPIAVQEINAASNLLAEADVVGRPMLLIRIGGRLPDPKEFDPSFLGTGGPIAPSAVKVSAPQPPRRNPAEPPADTKPSDANPDSPPEPAKKEARRRLDDNAEWETPTPRVTPTAGAREPRRQIDESGRVRLRESNSPTNNRIRSVSP